MPAREGKLVYQRGTTRRCSTLSRTGVPGLFINSAVTGTTCNRALYEVMRSMAWGSKVGGRKMAGPRLGHCPECGTHTLVFQGARDRPARLLLGSSQAPEPELSKPNRLFPSSCRPNGFLSAASTATSLFSGTSVSVKAHNTTPAHSTQHPTAGDSPVRDGKGAPRIRLGNS